MCGISGYLGNFKNGFYLTDMDMFAHMMVLNSFRGADSTGISLVTKDNETYTSKVLGHSWDLLKSDAYKAMSNIAVTKGRFLIGHGRSATFGEKTIENAHPFRVTQMNDDGTTKEDIILVHNGTLEHHNEGMSEFKVDSEWMANQIVKVGAKAALESTHGAVATIWYDKVRSTLNIYRNSQRPLFWAEDKAGNVYINSEPSVLVYLEDRFKMKFSGAPVEFKAQKLHTINLDVTDHSNESYWTEEHINYPTFKGGWGGGKRKRGGSTWDTDKYDYMFDDFGNYVEPEKRKPPYNVAPTYIPSMDSKTIRDNFNALCKGVINKTILKVYFGGGMQYVHKPVEGKQPDIVTSKMEPPIAGLRSIVPFQDDQVEISTSINGVPHTAYRTLADLALEPERRREVEKPVLVLPPPSMAHEAPALTKQQQQLLGVKYALPLTPKVGKAAKWTTRGTTMMKNLKVTRQIEHNSFSENKNPFIFEAYGNDHDGYFFNGQTIVCKLDYTKELGSTNVMKLNSCSLLPEPSSGLIKVVYPSTKEGSPAVGMFVSGKINMIRAATKEEYEQENIYIVIQIGAPTSVGGWATSKINNLADAPKSITTIGAAMFQGRKNNAA